MYEKEGVCDLRAQDEKEKPQIPHRNWDSRGLMCLVKENEHKNVSEGKFMVL